jgi:hypothetical protein
MADWGPGSAESPESALTGGESDFGGEAGQSPSEDQQSSHERVTGSHEPTDGLYDFDREDLTDGSVQEVVRAYAGEYGFLPVFGFNESNIAARLYNRANGLEDDETTINPTDEPLTIGGKQLTWWEDDSIMAKHPFMLVNPLGFASVDPEVHNFREVFRTRKGEHFVFADSGGYQVMSMDEADVVDDPGENNFKDYRVNPERLVEWQTKNADAGATLDFPPYNISGDAAFPDSTEFDDEWKTFYQKRKARSGEMTKRMAKQLAALRASGDEDAEDYIFAPVIHGKPHPQDTQKLVRQWHREMAHAAGEPGVEPRGWVVKPEPSHNFGQIALHLGYAAEHLQDAQFIHVLMVGGILQKTLLMYYAKLSGQFVTSDASSYAAGGMRRQFDLPGTAGRRNVIISSRDDDDDNAAKDPNDLNRYPCKCMVCSTVERDLGFDFVKDGSGSARSVSMNLHNLQQSLNIERTFDALLRENDVEIVETGGDPTGAEFWRLASGVAQQPRVEDLYRAMDYIRLAVNDSLSAANRQYRVLWEKRGGRSIIPAGGPAGDADW